MTHRSTALVACIVLLGACVAQPVRAAHGGHVVIGEVVIGGASAKDEVVELANPTGAAVDLTGWRLAKRTASGNESNLLTTFPTLSIPAHGSITIAHPEGTYAAGASATYSTSGSIAADNTLVLYAPLADGVRPIVDLVGWGSATSFEGAGAAPNPDAGQVLERKPGGDDHGQDTDDNTADFFIRGAETPPPTPPQDEGEGQQTDAPSDDADDDAPPASQPLVEPSRVAPPPTPKHVRINEFVSDPADGEVEWVELYNTGAEAVNLTDWTIEDGTERRTVLSGVLPAGGYIVVEEPAGKLNNGGDRIALAQPDGTLVDAVTYGDWDDGDRSNNAPTASDPASIARVTDGGDSDNDRRDWVRTETPTRGAPNVVASVPDAPTRGAVRDDATPKRRAIVVLNELLPNPAGGDGEEFIEVANIGDWGATLDGWRLRDELGTEYVIVPADGATALGAGAVLALPRTRTGIALNNTGGETVRLFTPDGERAASLTSYAGAAPEGQSYARSADGRWTWSTTVTAGTTNTVTPPNRAPAAVIEAPAHATPGAIVTFEGTDSADPDSEMLTYLWDFGDPATEADVATTPTARYVYAQPGAYTVVLTVADPRGGTARAEHRVTIGNVREQIAAAPTPSADAQAPVAPLGSIRLSELLPNPTGSDTAGEWIEVENTSDAAALLGGWTLAVIGATDRTAALPSHTIPAHGAVAIPRDALRVALANSGATIELRAPDGSIADSVTYGSAREGWSFARRDEATWEWTAAPTPNAPNAFVAGVRIAAGARAGAPAGSTGAVRVPLAALDDVPPNTDVIIRGTVTAAPGDVGAQVLYVEDGGAGVQVYIGKRAIPTLARGATVEVTGEYRMAGGEPRVGIRAPEDVRVLGAGAEPEPATLRIADASDARVGSLVTIEGEVMERRGSIVHVDDGSEELRVALAGADATEGIRMGDTIRAVGILSKTTSGFRVLARAPQDVNVLTRAAVADAATLPRQPLRSTVEIGVITASAGALILASFVRRRKTM